MKRRIRILHTLCRVNSGGVEQRRVLLANGLPPDLYEHTLICQEAAGAIPDILRAAGWNIHEIGIAPHILSPSWHNCAFKIARAFKPDIVHGAVFEGEALACSIGLRLPEVKVIMEETSDPINRRWTGNLLMRGICLRADACIGVSPRVSRYLLEKLRISKQKVYSISNAVQEVPMPNNEQLEKMRSILGIRRDDVIIGSVGRLIDSHKRFSDVIKALMVIRKSNSRVRLLIVGDGPDRMMLQKLAEDLDQSEAVIFAGYQSEVRDFYHLMKVFVLASSHEAFGLVLVEAMLAGVPIVATEVGGIPFVLDWGQAGKLVPSYRSDLLAQEIINLIENPIEYELLKRNGFKRAKEEFSAKRYVSEVADLYSKLLGNGRGH